MATIRFTWLLLATSVIFANGCSPKPEVTVQAGSLQMAIASNGSVVGLFTEPSGAGAGVLAPDQPAPLLSIRVQGQLSMPVTARWSDVDSTLRLAYRNGIEAEVRIAQKNTHAAFEVVAVSDVDRVELVLWGPYPTLLNDVIGETVGVVQGGGFAIGLQALNPRTLGGFPWKENDAMPQLDIFESGDFSDLNEEGKRGVLYRVEAAKPDSFGSTLQAYTRNRSEDRVIPNLGASRYVAPAFDDGGVVGSRIAIFGSTTEEALASLGAIELAEGLPHPMLDGVWAKQSPRASQAYVIMPFGEGSADEALDVVQQAGMQYLYHPGLFSSWGHFGLDPTAFPNGIDGLRSVVDRAGKRGMRVGAHTLSNFIQTHDAYVTPVPDHRLAQVGATVLTGGVSAGLDYLPVESLEFFDDLQSSTLQTVVIGTELIQFEAVSDREPWQILGVKRGAFGTQAAKHEAGDAVAFLADHGYRVFLTDPALAQEMAGNISRVFREAGLRHISFDGLEGNRSTGLGNYGEVLFTQSWFDALGEEAEQNLIVTASRTSHYFWHLYTRMNWGEPWYAGFRESQTEYRMKNQKYFRRNFMPGMLGWFSMRPETSVEDIEWMLARSAAYDAGYAFYTSFEALESNGRADEVLDLLSVWEEARLSGAFSSEQKARMEDVSGEFHLESVDDGSWLLYPVTTFRFEYEQRDRQPGEPAMDTYHFENAGAEQVLAFSLTATSAVARGVALSIDGVREIMLPLPLNKGQSVHYAGGDRAIIYSATWQSLGTINLDPTDFLIRPGPHDLGFVSEEGDLRIELRITRDAEAVPQT